MLRAAVVGCGAIGRQHLRALASLPEVDVPWVVDPVAELAEAAAAELGAAALARVEDIPDQVDLVTVATPPARHYTIVRDLLRRNLAVFCEKPLTLNLASAEELVRLAAERGLHLGVGFKMRYEPWFATARELLPQIGPVLQVVTSKQQRRHDKAWLSATGAMQELSSHDFDLIHWLTGARPTRVVHAHLGYRLGWPAEDSFALTVEYDTGMVGSLNGLYGDELRFTGRDQTMRFAGERGLLVVDRGERVVLHRDRAQEWRYAQRPDTFALELARFVAALTGGAADYPDGEAAVRSLWVVENAYRAAGRPVPVQPGFEEG